MDFHDEDNVDHDVPLMSDAGDNGPGLLLFGALTVFLLGGACIAHFWGA